jgi:hypothetical protein
MITNFTSGCTHRLVPDSTMAETAKRCVKGVVTEGAGSRCPAVACTMLNGKDEVPYE